MEKMSDTAKKEMLIRMCSHKENGIPDTPFVQSLIKERMQYLPEKKLYKFRTCEEKNLDTLRENCIWLSPANEFSDVFDALINIDLDSNASDILRWMTTNTVPIACCLVQYWNESNGVQNEFKPQEIQEFADNCLDADGMISQEKTEQYIVRKGTDEAAKTLSNLNSAFDKFRKIKKNMNDTASEWMPKMLKKINDMRNSMRNSMVIYCMTERKDNHSLWENYANKYRGFCIEYNFENFSEHRYEDYENLAYLFPMSYVDEKPVYDLLPLMKESLQEILTGDKRWQNDPKMNAELNMQLLYKKDDYQYEREWRFTRKGTNGRKCYFPFVSALYAGKDISEDDFQKLLEIGKHLAVPVYKQKVDLLKSGYRYDLIQEA